MTEKTMDNLSLTLMKVEEVISSDYYGAKTLMNTYLTLLRKYENGYTNDATLSCFKHIESFNRILKTIHNELSSALVSGEYKYADTLAIIEERALKSMETLKRIGRRKEKAMERLMQK